MFGMAHSRKLYNENFIGFVVGRFIGLGRQFHDDKSILRVIGVNCMSVGFAGRMVVEVGGVSVQAKIGEAE